MEEGEEEEWQRGKGQREEGEWRERKERRQRRERREKRERRGRREWRRRDHLPKTILVSGSTGGVFGGLGQPPQNFLPPASLS